MNQPEHFEMLDGIACYRPVAKVSFQEVIELIAIAFVACHENRIRKLLVNATGLTGFQNPNTSQRFQLAERMAFEAKAVVVAMVVKEEMIDPERFGVNVAMNRGLIVNLFTSEADALKWLLEQG